MFLTKECDYGIRIIRALADGEKKSVETICEIEHIPNKFAYKIIGKLLRAGFVQSLRGRGGGYVLAKPLDTFSIYDIIAVIDGNFILFECLDHKIECPHRQKHGGKLCSVHLEYARIQNIIEHEMQSKTISDIME